MTRPSPPEASQPNPPATAMRRDSLFYRLFQQSPSLLFELLDAPPPDAAAYRFDSVAVKEPKFEIDGVFLPPEGSVPGTVYFCEVQFQRDDQLYERLFSESFLYFYRQRHLFDNWQAVVIYPSRSIEQHIVHPYQALLSSHHVHRIFLDELGEPRELPLGLGLIVLTSVTENQAPEQARELVSRTQQEVADPMGQQAIIDLITTIMVYRFTQLSRQEVEAMLGLQLEDSRVYREAKEEGRQVGIQEGRQVGIQEGRQVGIQEGRQVGIQEGRNRQANLLLKLLQHKLGEVPPALATVVRGLDFAALETLGEALFDLESFGQVAERLVLGTEVQTAESTVQTDLLLQLLTGCLGDLDGDLQTRVAELPVAWVQGLTHRLFEWQSQDELAAWLRSQPTPDTTVPPLEPQ